jgi:hypothetical protein
MRDTWPGLPPAMSRKKVADRAQRQVVALDLVADDQLLEFRRQNEVAADEALDEAGLRETIHAAALGRMGHPCCANQRQIARLAEAFGHCVVRLVELRKLADEHVGKADAEEPADDDGVAAMDQPHSLAS